MGGNALKHLNVVRLDTTEYAKRLGEFTLIAIDYLSANPHDELMFGFPVPLKYKEDYGDLDVIYTINPTRNEAFVKFLEERFVSRGSKKNGNVKSVEWNNFQVDLIFVQPEVFDWALNWYSHGDHAAVQGRVYRYYKFKYGWDGLYYSYGTKSFHKDILVTRDWKEGNDILGYKPLFYECEYTENDVFLHTVSSPYAFSDIFETLKMDRPRPSQIRFYEWVTGLPSLKIRKKYSRSKGLELLRNYSFSMYVGVIMDTFWMRVREIFNPLWRASRKFWYKYLSKRDFIIKRKEKKDES